MAPVSGRAGGLNHPVFVESRRTELVIRETFRALHNLLILEFDENVIESDCNPVAQSDRRVREAACLAR